MERADDPFRTLSYSEAMPQTDKFVCICQIYCLKRSDIGYWMLDARCLLKRSENPVFRGDNDPPIYNAPEHHQLDGPFM
jgi:hypothetical protein